MIAFGDIARAASKPISPLQACASKNRSAAPFAFGVKADGGQRDKCGDDMKHCHWRFPDADGDIIFILIDEKCEAWLADGAADDFGCDQFSYHAASRHQGLTQ